MIKHMKKVFFAFIFLLLFLQPISDFQLHADEINAFDVIVKNNVKKESFPSKVINLYQKYISSLNGPKCRFYPTCSEFCKLSIDRYGLVFGVFMTVDRMFYRENELAMRHYQYLKDRDSWDDPVYHNFIFNGKGYYR